MLALAAARLQETEGSATISPWHDIELKVSPVSARSRPLPPPRATAAYPPSTPE